MAAESPAHAFSCCDADWRETLEQDWMKVSQIQTPALMYNTQVAKKMTGKDLARNAEGVAKDLHKICMEDPGRDATKALPVDALVGVWEMDLGYFPVDWYLGDVMNVSHVLRRLEREAWSTPNVSYLCTSTRSDNACIPPLLYILALEDAENLYNPARNHGRRGLQIAWSIQWESNDRVFQGFQRKDATVPTAISDAVYTTFHPCSMKKSVAFRSTMQRAILRVSCSRYDSEMPIYWFQSTYTLAHWEHCAWVQGMILYIASDNVRNNRTDAWAIHAVSDYLDETGTHGLDRCMQSVWRRTELWDATNVGPGRWQVKVRNKSGITFYVVVWQERRLQSGQHTIHFATSRFPVVTDAEALGCHGLRVAEPYNRETFYVWCDQASHDDFMFRAWDVVDKRLGCDAPADDARGKRAGDTLASMGPRSFPSAGALYMAWMDPSAHEVRSVCGLPIMGGTVALWATVHVARSCTSGEVDCWEPGRVSERLRDVLLEGVLPAGDT